MRYRLALFLALLLPLAAGATTIEMKVNGLVCAFCAQGIEKTLRKQASTQDVVVSLEHRLVAVALKDGADISDEQLRKALTDSGYDVEEIKRTDTPIGEIRQRVSRKAK